MDKQGYVWWKELNRYHWFVLVVAALGWLFDTMDQQLFNLARVPAMRDLLATAAGPASKEDVAAYSGYATAIFLLGWATGGLIFGVLGDRYGRARVMLWTILVYSLCTGLSAFATGFWDFSFYRFITGLGVGGEFAVGVALVAEVMPDRARPFALGWLQALSAVGNVSAALISMSLARLEATGVVGDWNIGGFQMNAWRLMFVVGTLPALLAVLIRSKLKEPDRWQHAVHDGAAKKTVGLYGELFGDPRWRHHAIVGMLMAFAGVVGLWGIGFFSFDLFDAVFRKHFEAQGLDPAGVAGKIGFWKGITSVLQNVGGFFGIYAFSRITHLIGRRPAFALSYVAAMLSTALVFWCLDEFSEIFWMIPLMGFCQLSIFGGFAIYFPELFPTRLRSTGTSFCYNVGRFVAAVGPFTFGLLTSKVFVGLPHEPMRYAGVTMCAIFLLGMAALPFAPETRGKPLPE
ncbi:MAG: MFS transporter [Pirellulales bacterium]